MVRYNGDAEVVNESDGVVKTSGTGAMGIQVDVDNMGTAKVTNRGSVTTTGGGFSHQGPNAITSGADGVTATSELGDAEGTNEGIIDTTGEGAMGMRIASNGAGTATATNRGRVTTRGDVYSVEDEEYGWRDNRTKGGWRDSQFEYGDCHCNQREWRNDND